MKLSNLIVVGFILTLLGTSMMSCHKGDDPTPNQGIEQPTPDNPNNPSDPSKPDDPVNPSDPNKPDEKKFTVKFVADGAMGNLPEDITAAENTSITVPECAATKTDYLFAGWKDASGKVYQPGDKITLTADITLTAVWMVDTDPVLTFSADAFFVKGKVPAKMRIREGGAVLPGVGDMRRVGFKFLGWSSVKGAVEPEYLAGDVLESESPVTLYTVWESFEFSITYHFNNDARLDKKMVCSGIDIEGDNYEGYFRSWSPLEDSGHQLVAWKDADGNIYRPDGLVSIDIDIDLYAVYGGDESSVFDAWTVKEIK